MELFVLQILRMSFEALIVTAAVLFLRFLFRRLPKGYSCVLWLLVLFRLLCPVTVSSSVSLMPNGSIWQEGVRTDAGENRAAVSDASAQAFTATNEETGQQLQAAALSQAGKDSAQTESAVLGKSPVSLRKKFSDQTAGIIRRTAVFWQRRGRFISLIWAVGVVFWSAFYLAQLLQWRKRNGLFSGERREKKRYKRSGKGAIIENERIKEPFVYGVIRPVICLPAGMEERERAYILCHERMHVRHGDPLLRLLWQIALILHWFNPFVWLSVFLMRKDAEMFCDESVTRQYGQGARKEYALTLLRFSMKKSGLSMPVAFGESDTESRVRHILKVKRPALTVSLLAVGAIVLAAVFLLTNPKREGGEGDASPAGVLQETDVAADAGSVREETGSPQNREEELLSAAQRWAETYRSRDGEKLLELVADPASMDRYRDEEGYYSIGWSSPWPWGDDHQISYAKNRDEAIIHYYANTSDPSVLLWRQVVTFVWRDGVYLAEDWETEETAIASAAEFWERLHYESGEEYNMTGSGYRFRNTPLDVFYRTSSEEESRADLLIWQEEEQVLSDVWRQPETAAAAQLYLDGGNAVEVDSPWVDKVCLRWEFEDGLTDVICLTRIIAREGSSATQAKEQESGIWVVEDILEEAVYQQELQTGSLRSYYMERPEELAWITQAGPEGIMEIGREESGVVRISETEEGDIVLYGLVQGGWTEGVLLFSKGRCQYFDWYYSGPRMDMPNLILRDYDGDGQQELAVILLAATGTGVSIEQLFMLEEQEDGLWSESEFTEYMQQVEAEIIWEYEEETRKILVRRAGADDPIGEMDVADLFAEDDVYESVCIGDIVTFVPEDNEMYVQMLTGVRMQGEAVGQYGDYALRARVNYEKNRFTLSDYEIISLGGV